MLFLAVFILVGGLLILHSVPFVKRDIIATGFLADIVITFPVAYYFLIIRPFKLKARRILVVISACLVVAYLVLPVHQQYYVLQLRKLNILAELGFLIYVISKLKHIIHYYQIQYAGYQDFAFDLLKSLVSVLGDGLPVRFFASEITILRFGLGCWKKFPQEPATIKRFSVFKDSGYASLFGVILFVALIEIVVFHLLLNQYSSVAAIILSFASAYGLIFFVGDFSAIVKSPILFLPGKILFRTGFRWRAMVNINNIASAEKITGSYKPDETCFRGSVMKNSANMLLTFKHPIYIDRIYQKLIIVDKIMLSIDQVDAFLEELNSQSC
ncbi:MAG: hypothetical protein ACRYFB_14110 [Janthinobacterium lividum]